MEIQSQNFGLEVEMTGLTRREAAQTIARYFGTSYAYDGGVYDAYSVLDQQGRKWKVMSDGSLNCQQRVAGERVPASRLYSVEVVSPICQYDDIPTVQEIVRQLRQAGAFVNSSCGIHIHINAAPFTAPKLRNLVNIMAAKEDMIYKALRVDAAREEHYCQKIDQRFLEELNRKRPETLEQFKKIWYQGADGSQVHYHPSRYHCLDLHSVFQKGTIEFRAFNSELHAGKIKAYLQFCMAVTAQAYNQRSASPTKTVSDNEKYTFRVWLLRLGLIGDEFKTARLHLLNHLEGNIAWKDPTQAQRQKERLREQAEQAARAEQAPQPIEEPPQMEPEEESPGFVMSM